MKKKIEHIIRTALKDKDQKEIIKKGSSFLLFRFGGILAGYVFTYIIATQYGAAVNGLIALSFTIFLLISILGRLGIDANLVKYYSSDKNWSENPGIFYRVLIKSIFISVLLAFLVYYFREFIAVSIFNKPQLEPYFLWTTMAIPCWVITIVCSGLLRAKKMNNWFAFLNNPGRFIFTLLALFLLGFFYFDEVNPIKAHFFGLLALSILALVISIKHLRKVTFKSNENSWDFMREAFPMMLSTTMIIMLGWMDTFVLGIYETDAAVGVYNVALKISALTVLSLEAVSSILAPKIAQYYQDKDMEQFHKLIKFSAKLIFIISGIVVVGILLFHNVVLGFFGEEFKSGAFVLIILCVGQLVSAFSGSVGVILQMINRQKTHQNYVFIALIVNVVLNFTLIPIYGLTGAAVATTISMATWNFLGAWYLNKKLNIKSYFRL